MFGRKDGALVMYTDIEDSVRLLTSYETEGIWRTRTFLSKDVYQGPFQMFFVSSALETLLVRTDTMLYSFHNDLMGLPANNGFLQLKSSCGRG